MKPEFATVTTRGRIVIPATLRHKLGIRKGTRVAILEDKNRLILEPVSPRSIRSLRPPPKTGSVDSSSNL